MMTAASPATTTHPPFSAFLSEHRVAVLGFLHSMVGPVDADDCFQETFMAALRAYETLDGKNPRAWVLTIARNKAVDHHRGERKRGIPKGEKLPEVPVSDPPAPDGEVWQRVEGLPQRQREAVALRFGADLAYREIGAAMETTAQAARRNVHEGLKRLQTQMKEER
ncbi:RNA polymerase sigma factor [soil metagenome]